MRKTKKTLSVLLAALMIVLTCMTYVPAGAAEVSSAAPEIAFLGIEHSPLVEGQKESFFLTAKNADKVLYSAVLKDETGKEIENLTKGWTDEEPGNIPFEIESSTEFKAGKYKLVVDAKRASDGKTLIKPYIADLNCIPKDSKCIDVSGNADTDKDEYTVGEKITVDGIQGISGKIEGPYMYKLHVYNASTDIWTKNAVAEYGDKIEWTPSTPGTYILDIYANSKKSTTWAKYDKNHASEDTTGTYEAWKLVTVNVVEAPKVTNIAAINKKTIKVSYNMELGKVQVPNFAVYDKEDQYSQKTIKSVSVDKNVVTINMEDSLVNAGEYTLTSTNISNVDNTRTLESSKDNFTYTEIDTPASIAFVSSTVAMGDTVKYVIKDKDGNDITPNITDGTNGNIIIETSNPNTVDSSFVAQSVGVAVVNLSIENTTIATGNTIIKVVTTLRKPTTIGRVAFVSSADAEPDYTAKLPSLYVGGNSQYIKFETFDQNGDEMEWDEASNKTTPPAVCKVRKRFRSSSPNVVVVDEGTGKITPVAAGNAIIIVTATDAYGNTVSKSVDVTVKAAQVFTSLDISQTSYDVVIGSPIPITLNVYALDQNGDYMQGVLFDHPIFYTINKVQYMNWMPTLGKNFLYIEPDSGITAPKSVKVTITCGTEKKNITLNYISKGEFARYKLSAYDIYSISMFPSLLDKDEYQLDIGEDSSRYTSVSGKETFINVFKSDSDGNLIGSEFKYDEDGVITDYGTNNITLETESKGIVTTDGMKVTAVSTGSETVAVKIGSATVGKITFNVINHDLVPKTLEIVNNAVTVSKGDTNVFAALFGTNEKGAAFIAYDQEGNKIQVKPGDVKIYSSDSEVINNSLEAGSKAGTALITIIVADKAYTVTVKVQ